MRRKVTLNVDDGWLAWIDGRRGLIPRSRYVEVMTQGGTLDVADIQRKLTPPVKAPLPVAERSPAPTPKSAVPVAQEARERPVRAPRAQPRPIVQKRG